MESWIAAEFSCRSNRDKLELFLVNREGEVLRVDRERLFASRVLARRSQVRFNARSHD